MATVFVKKYGKSRKRKYHNRTVDSEDGKFDSKLEYRRWLFLKAAQMAGQITELERQVAFSFDIGSDHICKYISDFTYRRKGGEYVVSDAKGIFTDVFKLKAKMMRIFYGIEVYIVKTPSEPV